MCRSSSEMLADVVAGWRPRTERAGQRDVKSWKILRKIYCCPPRTTALVKAVEILVLAG